MATVIINHTRDCIVQDGVKYCETSNLTPEQLGTGILAIIAICLYLWFLGWLAIEREYNGFLVVLIGLILPTVALAIILIKG